MAQDASTPLYIVPRGHNTRLCAVQEGQFIDLAPLPFAAQSVFVRGDEGWWACMVKKGRRRGGKIARFQVLHEREIRASPAIVLPQGYSALAIAIKGQTLYVGGGGRTADMLGLYDLQASQPRWHTLEVPPSLRQQGKQIDALLLHDDRLLAVDNLVLPKWLLTYDVTVPETPCLLDVYKLPAHGTYEQVHQGAIGMHWWALLSGTVGMTGEAQHLALYSTQQRQEYGSVLELAT